MSAISDHKRNLNQAKDDLNRMIQEVNALLDSPEPDHQRLAKLFDLMEHSCRSGFNNAFDLHYTQHSTTEPKATQEIPA